MKGNDNHRKPRGLAVVARAPLEGSVKTRLSPDLSPADAATLYECLLADIVAKLEKHKKSEFWLAFTAGGKEAQNDRSC
jgi:glycosyltransferase A (GT-A) superfamily protein (DUF2064 family)